MDKLQFLVLIVIYRPSLRALAAHRQRASLITLSIGPSNFVVTPALRYSSGSIHRTVYSSHLLGEDVWTLVKSMDGRLGAVELGRLLSVPKLGASN